MLPKLLTHFPTPNPTTLRMTNSAINPSEAVTRKNLIVGKRLVARAQDKNRDADKIQHDGRNIHHVVRPVAPARKKPMKVAEDLLGPEIHAAFARVAMGEFDNGDSLRQKEEQERNQPQPNRDAAVRGDARDHIEIEHRYDKERDQVPASEHALEVHGTVLRGIVVRQSSLPD